jgi:hypothetical protein
MVLGPERALDKKTRLPCLESSDNKGIAATMQLQTTGFKKRPMLRPEPFGNWSVATALPVFLFATEVLGAENSENRETFLHHLRGNNVHPAAFSQEAMVMAYNCEGSMRQKVVFLDPSQCKGNLESQENVVQQTIVFMPRPDEHEMFVCEASLSIQGGVCGFANLQYQNILNNNDIQLSRKTCKQHHTKLLAVVKVNEIALSTMGANGLYTHV